MRIVTISIEILVGISKKTFHFLKISLLKMDGGYL